MAKVELESSPKIRFFCKLSVIDDTRSTTQDFFRMKMDFAKTDLRKADLLLARNNLMDWIFMTYITQEIEQFIDTDLSISIRDIEELTGLE